MHDTPLAMTEFGGLLRNFRQKTRITQKEFSKKIGVSKITVSEWENTHSFPSHRGLLQKIADILQIPYDEFLKLKGMLKFQRQQNLILK